MWRSARREGVSVVEAGMRMRRWVIMDAIMIRVSPLLDKIPAPLVSLALAPLRVFNCSAGHRDSLARRVRRHNFMKGVVGEVVVVVVDLITIGKVT